MFLDVVHYPSWQLETFGLGSYVKLVTDGILSVFNLLKGLKLFGNFSLLHFLVLCSVLELVIMSLFVIYDFGGDSQSYTDNVTFDKDTGEVIKLTRTNHYTHKDNSRRIGFRRR